MLFMDCMQSRHNAERIFSSRIQTSFVAKSPPLNLLQKLVQTRVTGSSLPPVFDQAEDYHSGINSRIIIHAIFFIGVDIDQLRREKLLTFFKEHY